MCTQFQLLFHRNFIQPLISGKGDVIIALPVLIAPILRNHGTSSWFHTDGDRGFVPMTNATRISEHKVCMGITRTM